MRLLVIVDQELRLDTDRLSSISKEDVSINAPTKDGISVYTCGKTIPWEYDWTAFIQIGQCAAERKMEPSVIIDRNSDILGELLEHIDTLQSGNVGTIEELAEM